MSRTMRELAEAFAETVERASAEMTRDRGSSPRWHVTYRGDFANTNPSTMSRLMWWAREFREALEAEPKEPT